MSSQVKYTYKEWKTCKGKKFFKSHNQASKWCEKRRRIGLRLFVYLCPHCDGYHTTKKEN